MRELISGPILFIGFLLTAAVQDFQRKKVKLCFLWRSSPGFGRIFVDYARLQFFMDQSFGKLLSWSLSHSGRTFYGRGNRYWRWFVFSD